MLYDFLLKNQEEILALTAEKTLELVDSRPTSDQLKAGLPVFYDQLVNILKLEEAPSQETASNQPAMARAATQGDEAAMARASAHPDDVELAKTAGLHGRELLRLGYTLSHVVHAYGSMCQSITELATSKDFKIAPGEFHDLNRCLDVAIAGAVTEFQSGQNTKDISREVEHLGFLAHELRNALTSVTIALQLIKRGTVGFSGSTGQVLDQSLKRIESLIDRSLTEVRLRMNPKIQIEIVYLLRLVDQIAVTANIEAHLKNQTLEIDIEPKMKIAADQGLIYSTLSNLIHNAIKFTRTGGKIQVRAREESDCVTIEVEDECGGLHSKIPAELFQPFEQRNEDREGMGLGLTIANRAMILHGGTVEARDLPGKGCVFKVTLPKRASALPAAPAA